MTNEVSQPLEPKPKGALPLTSYSRVGGFRLTTGETHLIAEYLWGPGIACDARYVTGRPEDVLVREISCEVCLGSLPGFWEVQVPDKRCKTGHRTLYTGFISQKAADEAARLFGKKGAKAVMVSMRELLLIEAGVES